ncbi:MAG TPA: hypothetical protein PKD09_19340 [Aggregatilinea sp.]|uniref:hypothetical protein n=1 Tax=Aggregatilinea sp. TaxID=2806333 RepID=UPI002C80FCA6|nr:hypothetical protein [Aggregatilinea sp.]HML23819.1 hypothetical protein [Aggregatilinea sp.]
MGIVLAVSIAAALVLIGAGAWTEVRSRWAVALVPVPVVDEAAPAAPEPEPLASPGLPRTLALGVRAAVRRHPDPMLAVIETVIWMLVAATWIDHLRAPRSGVVAQVVWALTIVPHEAGHLLCAPFGWTLQFAGGSIWQALIFVLPAVVAFVLRRQISTSLLFWAMVGHSFLNMAPYIGDASARDLPLLFGLSKDHHDWWNLLGHYGLLDYDSLFAAAAVIVGSAILLWAVLTGIAAAWLLPRQGIGASPRFEGGFWRALWDALRAGAAEDGLETDGGETGMA